MNYSTNDAKIRLSNGFTLIEVLITMLILAVGMLGISALQFRGLQYNHDAYLRTQVNFLAYDAADRVRLNRNNATNYAPSNYVAGTAHTACVQATAANVANDLNCWHDLVDSAMPAGSKAKITRAANIYEIELTWTDRSNDDHAIKYAFQP